MENLIQEPVRNTIIQPTLKGSKIGNTASRLRPKSKKSISNFDKSSMYKIQDPIEMSTVTRRYFDNLASKKIIEGIIKRQNAMTPDNERIGLKYIRLDNNSFKVYDFEYKISFFIRSVKGVKNYATYDKKNKEFGKYDDFSDINERTKVFTSDEYRYISRDEIDFKENSDPNIQRCKNYLIPKEKIAEVMFNQKFSQPQTIQNTNVNFKISDEEKKSSDNN